MELNSLNNFERGPPKEHSLEIILIWLIGFRGEVICRKMLKDRQTNDDSNGQ